MLLGTELIAISAAIQGHGPFATLAPQAGVLALQIVLIIVTVPFLCLAPLIEERRGAEHALGQRLHFEELLSGLAGAFLQLPSAKIDGAVAEWLGRVGDFFGLDAVLLLRGGGRDRTPEITHRWTTAALGPLPPEATDDLASTQSAGPDRGWWRVSVPLVAGGQNLGRMAFFGVPRRETARADEPRLSLVADVFAGALARQKAEDELRGSEAMKSAILTSLPSRIGVLDREGRLIAVNDSWTRFALLGGAGHESSIGVGASYIEACRRGDVSSLPDSQEALDGIEGVLAGWLSSYGLEYASRGPGAERWFAMLVVPLLRPEGGAIVSHTDVTERRRAGLEAQQSRQELAHFLRVSTMGELTTSLAHELNQPLTAILANAQAARLLLAGPKPDTKELREIISDVIDEDRRAGEIIQRLRGMLRKGKPQRTRLDINAVVEGVVHLLGSDALIRNVSIRIEPNGQMPAVIGDRVQIEQVVLNLLLNAMEAMPETTNWERKIVVRSEKTPDGHVRVSVADSGAGLRADALEWVFEPFYTTKAAGMGMGLSIARSIIEAHGGTISAANNPDGGAVFAFSLPPAR
jgi:signal transduction histidine kinase